MRRTVPRVLLCLLLIPAALAWHVPQPTADRVTVRAAAVRQPVSLGEPAPPHPAPARVVPHRASRSRSAAQLAAPSGVVMPRALAGWRQVLAQDFTGSRLPRSWTAYTGRPGGNWHGWWDRSHVAVRGNRLLLTGSWKNGRYTTGGVMTWAARGAYGRYEVRFRVQRAQGVSYCLLLWPSHGGWPRSGEIDFAEDGGGDRRATAATLHYGGGNRTVRRELAADFSHWQTVGVEWAPGRLTYLLNGRPWSTVRSWAVPKGPMDLALQLEAGRGESWSPAPSRRTPALTALEVDWAVGYRR